MRRRLVAVLVATAVLITTPAAAETVSLPDNPLRGRLLFENRGCSQCHGIGEAERGIGPALDEGRFGGSFLDLGAALWNHVPGMSVTFESLELAWPELTVAEATELMVFFYFVDYLGRPGVPVAGERVFRAGGCSGCHRVAGEGRDIGPDLTELEHFASPLYVAQEIWNHTPSMLEGMRRRGMSPPTFAPGDLADLSAFLRQKSRSVVQERLLLAPGNPNRGRDLFVAKGCARCHGAHGEGGDEGPDLRDADLRRSAEAIAGEMWNHALVMSASMRARGLGWPEFEGSEMADLIAYLYFLPFADPPGDPARGRRVFEERSCAECHAGADVGDAPDLARPGTSASAPTFVAAMWNHAPMMKETILAEGRPWPELSGPDLRDLLAFLSEPEQSP